jgi:NitT/TauT family transport system substrate-binding protein
MALDRQFIAAASLALIVAAVPVRADTEKATVALPAVAAIFSSAYVAQDAGIYKDVGLEVTEQLIAGIGAANAVIAGSIDFSNSSGVTLTRAAARGQPVIGIANTYDRSGFWILITKKVADERHFDPKAPLAERAKLLKGLRFAVGGIQAIPHAYLKAIVAAGGLDPDKDIVVAGITPPETPAAMQRGAIDGASIGPPQLNQLQQNDFAVIVANGTTADPVDPPWLGHIDANVILVKKQTCVDHKSLCAKMGQAMVKAAAYMHEHPKETMAILAKRLNITDQAVLEATYKNTVESTPLAPALDAKGLATADDLNVAAGFMPADQKLPSYDNIFTNEYVQAK